MTLGRRLERAHCVFPTKFRRSSGIKAQIRAFVDRRRCSRKRPVAPDEIPAAMSAGAKIAASFPKFAGNLHASRAARFFFERRPKRSANVDGKTDRQIKSLARLTRWNDALERLIVRGLADACARSDPFEREENSRSAFFVPTEKVKRSNDDSISKGETTARVPLIRTL